MKRIHNIAATVAHYVWLPIISVAYAITDDHKQGRKQ